MPCGRSPHEPHARRGGPRPMSVTSPMRHNDVRARAHPAYWAFVVHRVSGLVLTLFLPLHFWALSQALDPSAFDRFLAWTHAPAVRLTEDAIVVALAAHLAG